MTRDGGYNTKGIRYIIIIDFPCVVGVVMYAVCGDLFIIFDDGVCILYHDACYSGIISEFLW